MLCNVCAYPTATLCIIKITVYGHNYEADEKKTQNEIMNVMVS